VGEEVGGWEICRSRKSLVIIFNAGLGPLFSLAQKLSQKVSGDSGWFRVAFCHVLHLIQYRKRQFTFSEGVDGISLISEESILYS
jgi:hypothetical protein